MIPKDVKMCDVSVHTRHLSNMDKQTGKHSSEEYQTSKPARLSNMEGRAGKVFKELFRARKVSKHNIDLFDLINCLEIPQEGLY